MQKNDDKGIMDIIDGIRSVGLSELSEAGLPEAEYFVIPDICIREFSLKAIEGEEKKEAGAYEACKDLKAILDAGLVKDLVYDGTYLLTPKGEKLSYKIKEMTAKDQERALYTIADHFKALQEPTRTLKICANMICITIGWIQNHNKSESKIVKTLDFPKDKDKEISEKLIKVISKDAVAIEGLCIAATLNHWLTNHSLGGNIRNSMFERSYAFTSLSTEFTLKGRALRDIMYTIIHAVDKRNCLYSMARDIVGLSGIVTLGLRAPTSFFADKSIALRVNSIPAGNRRIDIAIALMKFAHENDIIACSKSVLFFKEIVSLREKALSIGVSAHIGAKFYSYGSVKPQVYKDLVNAKVNEVIIDYGNVALAIAPDSSLASSPIVATTVAANPRKPVVERAKALLNEVSKSAEEFAKSIQSEYLKSKYAIDNASALLKEIEDYMSKESEIVAKIIEERKAE